MELHTIERGTDGVLVALLHGFGLSHASWGAVLDRIEPERRVIAYDLPGHGGSLGAPHGSAAVAAKAVLADLARRNVDRVHLVGHSMGGATAALVALREPARVASLTLLAPGGFFPEIDHALLRRYAAATDEEEIAALLDGFFSPGHPPPKGLAASLAKERAVPGATAALKAIFDTFLEATQQRRLPLADLAALGLPIRIAWGTEDRVLPLAHPEELRGLFSLHLLEGVGHMPQWEVPAEVARLVPEAGN